MMLVVVRRRDLRMHEGIWAIEQCTRPHYSGVLDVKGGKYVHLGTCL